MYLVKTDLKSFAAAHRLVKNYTGKCAHLHGHNYRISLMIASTALNALDMVVDFDDIKTLCDTWVQQHLDHGTLICSSDHALLQFVQNERQKHYVLPEGRHATAEGIAEHLFTLFTALWESHRDRLNPNAFIHTVEVWESATSGAMFCHSGALIKGLPCGL